MSRVSILDKFPVAGIISDDVPTPRKYPARMVDAVTSDVRARLALLTSSATTTDPSHGARAIPAYRGRERNLLIRARETPGFSFPVRYPLTAPTAPKRVSARSFFISSGRDEEIQMPFKNISYTLLRNSVRKKNETI